MGNELQNEDLTTQTPAAEQKPSLRERLCGGGKAAAGKKPGGRKRRWLRIAVILLVAAGAGGFFIARQLKANAAKSDVTYTEEAVKTRTITQSLTGSGTLEPANSYTVTTLVAGDVTAAGFEEGDTVEKDTVLYQIDSSDSSTSIEKAQLSLSQAQRSYDDALDGAYIKAPVAGTLYSLDVAVGDEVQQGQTIATVRNSATMTLKVPFPADDAKTFYVGETAAVTLDGSFETLTGTVTAISGADIVSTGNSITRNVTIAVKNPGGLSNTQTATAAVAGINCAGSATFTFKADSTVTASSSGTVTAVNAREGAAVSKDQKLVTLGGDAVENQIQTAKDNLANAQLSMENAQDQLDNYTITSPIAGTIVDKEYKAGDKVESGTTLCTIYDLSYLEMTMSIDELDISQVSVGQSVSITADAVEGKTFTGTITKVSVAGTTTNGATSYPVTVRIDDTDDLLPGMNVDAVIVLSEADDVLSVSNAAVNRGDTVLVTKDSPSAANALDQDAPDGYVYVQVTTGVSDDDYIQITDGLQSGDTVAYVQQTSSSADSSAMMGGMMMGGGAPSGGMPSGGGGGAPSGGGGGAPSGGGGGQG